MPGRPRFPLIDRTIRDASPAAGGRDESESTSGRVNFRVVAYANGILVACTLIVTKST